LVEFGGAMHLAPLKSRFSAAAGTARKLVLSESQRALRQALAMPGNVAQRFFLKLTGLCAILLPLGAIGWVSWQAVTAYYASALTHGGYLGADFAIHSSLIVAISWLLPFFLNRQLKPSAERTAEKGLRTGIGAGLALIHVQVLDILANLKEDWEVRVAEGRRLLATEKPASTQVAPFPKSKILERMLIDRAQRADMSARRTSGPRHSLPG
jgi:hypothetical protein